MKGTNGTMMAFDVQLMKSWSAYDLPDTDGTEDVNYRDLDAMAMGLIRQMKIADNDDNPTKRRYGIMTGTPII